jgi:hypothetical protein
MSMSVGSAVAAASPEAVSDAASGRNEVKGEAAVSVLKKAMEADATIIKTLIAAATGVGKNLDTSG